MESIVGPRGVVVRLEQVGLTYPATRRGTDPVVALEGVSLGLAAGEFVAVVGPSGCGKSTLLRLLAGLRQPTAGRVLVAGVPVTGPRPDTAVVFQRPTLLPWRTVTGNVLLPAGVGPDGKGGISRDDRERAAAALRLVGLADAGERYPAELSGGMQQRVALARALVTRPSLLLMDEPFAALDLLRREDLAGELERIWLDGDVTAGGPAGSARPTVFFITHSIAEAVQLADRVLVMSPRPGRIVATLDVPLPRPRAVAAADPAGIAVAQAVRAALQRSAHDDRREHDADRTD